MTASTQSQHDNNIPIIDDNQELLQYGIVRARLPQHFDCEQWAAELTTIPPTSMMFEGDHEYPFYRNILETAPDFPIAMMLEGDDKSGGNESNAQDDNNNLPSITQALNNFFPLDANNPLTQQLKLDDAFCVSYNDQQADTTGAKHQDPSDITVNMCLAKSNDCQGSYVLFHGRRGLEDMPSNNYVPFHDKVLVPQLPGTATLHFGDHPHETTALLKGSRTNVILTYWYTEKETNVATRSCYC